ncbi:MAG: hypothetical protein GF331_21390 [Chitinivibrionales bacterium]|nr:hypothetical protein [Chitinivibrionales bacterium]
MVHMRSIVCGCVLLGVTVVGAQVVTFSDPSEWMTHGKEKLVVKAQLDTAQIESKTVEMTLSAVIDGRTRRLRRKRFAADDFYKEFDLGRVGRTVIGGHDYLSVDWRIADSDKEGTVAPIGVIVLEELAKHEPMLVRRIDDGLVGAAAADAIAANGLKQIGDISYGFGWNMKALWVVAKGAGGPLEVLIDGKNAKNAYLSYPDRILRLFPEADSAHAFHYTRELKDEEIVYTENTWHHDMVVDTAGPYVVAGMRWYDMGVIPAGRRTVGLGVFTLNADDEQQEALWEDSERAIPGTWGDLRLVE